MKERPTPFKNINVILMEIIAKKDEPEASSCRFCDAVALSSET